MAERLCLLCGGPIPPARWWWQRWIDRLLDGPPIHDPNSPEGVECYERYYRRVRMHRD